MNRRDFLKRSASVGALGAVGAISFKPESVSALSIGVKHHKTIDDMIKISDSYTNMKQKNTAFQKSILDEIGLIPLDKGDNPGVKHAFFDMAFAWSGGNPFSGERDEHYLQTPGYTHLDMAFGRGGIGLEDYTGSYFARIASHDSGPAIPMPDGSLLPFSLFKQNVPFPGVYTKAPQKHQFNNKEEASYQIKKAAKKLGASLVGIAPFDERWVYDSEVYIPLDPSKFPDKISEAPIYPLINYDRKVDFGFKPKSVIVMAHEIDYEAYKTATSEISDAVTSVQYSKMLEVSLRVGYFIRALGFNARHSGNDTSLSVPTAIQAGLGEGSRMGLLVTEEYGPRVRISKVFTDLELVYDQPKSFGVKEFCEVCQRCADACPSEAISSVKKTTEPENKPHNKSNNPGVDKWYNDGQKCLKFWGDNWGACGVCLAVCPYNKLDEWHHDLAKIVTKVPGLNSIARYLDEYFGYGHEFNEKLMSDFWKKDI